MQTLQKERAEVSQLAQLNDAINTASKLNAPSSSQKQKKVLEELLTQVIHEATVLRPTPTAINEELVDANIRNQVNSIPTAQLKLSTLSTQAICNVQAQRRLLFAGSHRESAHAAESSGVSLDSMASMGNGLISQRYSAYDNDADTHDNDADAYDLGEIEDVHELGESEEESRVSTVDYGGHGALIPAVKYFSTDDDVSVRVESRDSQVRDVYLELRGNNAGSGYKIGMDTIGHNLHLGYGTLGTASETPGAMEIRPDGTVMIHGHAYIKGQPVKDFRAGFDRGSGLSCIGGTAAVADGVEWSTCPAGYTVTGVEAIRIRNMGDPTQDRMLLSTAKIDHFYCNHKGCQVQCSASTGVQQGGDLRCTIVARCCKTEAAPLSCYNSNYHEQHPNQWGQPAFCDWKKGYRAVGLARLDLLQSQPEEYEAVHDFYVGWHYARSWCHAKHSPARQQHSAPACALQGRCCKPSDSTMKLHCVQGTKGYGSADQWGEWSVCPPYFTAVSVMRINTAASAATQNQRVAQYECKSDAKNDFEGCRAWAWQSEHSTWAKCCRVLPQLHA
jgi:hypothetical protein